MKKGGVGGTALLWGKIAFQIFVINQKKVSNDYDLLLLLHAAAPSITAAGGLEWFKRRLCEME